MSFLGKKLVGQFRGEVISDMTDRCKRRLPGLRIKHRAKMNWIKMYDKAGPVVRVEIVINQPEAFKFAKASDVVIGGEIKGQARFTFISLIPVLSPFRNRRTSTSRLTPARCSFVKNPLGRLFGNADRENLHWETIRIGSPSEVGSGSS